MGIHLEQEPRLPDTRYVDELIGPDTITTLPPATIEAVTDHGTVTRTIDHDLPRARDVLNQLGELGIDLNEVSATLEAQGVDSFLQAFRALSDVLAAKAAHLAAQRSR